MSAHAADATVARELFATLAAAGHALACVTVGEVSIQVHAPMPGYAMPMGPRAPSVITKIGGSDDDARAELYRQFGGDAIDSLVGEDDDGDEDEVALDG